MLMLGVMRDSAQQLDSRQLTRLKRGDSEAWRDFIATWSPMMYSYVFWNTPSAHVATVMTMVWSNIARSIQTYDGRIDGITWLHTITYQTMHDWNRGRREYRSTESFGVAAESQTFLTILNELPEQVRAALVLYHRQGLSEESVAEVLGRTVKATRALLERGQRLLRFSLNDLDRTP